MTLIVKALRPMTLAILFSPTVLAQTERLTDSERFLVTLLGTGYPTPRIDRLGPSTLVEVGDQRLLFDCGRAATIRLTQLGIRLSSVQDVFLTHLHSDHVSGLLVDELDPDRWQPLSPPESLRAFGYERHDAALGIGPCG
jgi:metal-dependent hydrolase (beta-lactamase superfamily II)